MPAGRGSIAGGASVILLGVAPMLIFHVTRDSAPGWLVGAVAAVQITALAWLLSGKWALRHRAVVVIGGLGIGAALLIVTGAPASAVGLGVAGGCHAIAYSSLLLWFGASLRPGREPVVTGFARRVRRTMPDKVVRYTRQVTIAWSVFFAAQLTGSAVLLLMAPEAVWSGFVNLLNLPLLAAMVVAEAGCRLILFRHEPRTSLIDTLSLLRRARITPASPP
jgi:uncharacterized membrane protein